VERVAIEQQLLRRPRCQGLTKSDHSRNRENHAFDHGADFPSKRRERQQNLADVPAA
jgi:hypothetical protein